jgi:hypothetical protein
MELTHGFPEHEQIVSGAEQVDAWHALASNVIRGEAVGSLDEIKKALAERMLNGELDERRDGRSER